MVQASHSKHYKNLSLFSESTCIPHLIEHESHASCLSSTVGIARKFTVKGLCSCTSQVEPTVVLLFPTLVALPRRLTVHYLVRMYHCRTIVDWLIRELVQKPFESSIQMCSPLALKSKFVQSKFLCGSGVDSDQPNSLIRVLVQQWLVHRIGHQS